jgi:hypothetical protein
MNWENYRKTSNPLASDAESLVISRTVPLEVINIVSEALVSETPHANVRSIKLLHEHWGLSILSGKRLIDAAKRCGGIEPPVSSDVIDAIEATMDACRVAVRKADGEIRQQLDRTLSNLDNLWRQLTGL